MPIYEFECDNEDCEANLRYEKELSINEPHTVICQFCHGAMRKVYSSVGFIPTSGMYAADNRR